MNDLLTVGIFSTMFYSFFEFLKKYIIKYILVLIGMKEYIINQGTYIQIMNGSKFTVRPKYDNITLTKYGIINSDYHDNILLTTFDYFFKKISKQKQSRYFHSNDSSFLLDERFKPKDNQIEILKEINLVFNEKNNCVVLLIGVPGIGKSRVSLLLSQQLNCCVLDCNVSTIDHYYKKYYVDNNPIIFIIDEVDIELESIENVDLVNISRKDEYVFTKKEWNTIFDHIDLGFYPGLIILMTSNKMNDGYNSELRRGRIDIKYTMTN
jgi:hypothetical protein